MAVSLAMLYNIDIFMSSMANDKVENIQPPILPKTGLILRMVVLNIFLVVVFGALLCFLWFKLPMEGVKLHGTVDSGVDLLGAKNDLFWFGGFGFTVFVFNNGLAFFMLKREKLAS